MKQTIRTQVVRGLFLCGTLLLTSGGFSTSLVFGRPAKETNEPKSAPPRPQPVAYSSGGVLNNSVKNNLATGRNTSKGTTTLSLKPTNTAYYNLATGPFQQNWSNTNLITTNDNWDNVPSITGYRGDDLTSATGTDPQTILANGSSTPVNVLANLTSVANNSGAVAEFEITNPTIALQGSGTADAPHIVIFLNTTGVTTATVAYNLRDIDNTADNANQAVALQYRVGGTGNFTNIPAAYVADATSGPNSATQVTPVSVSLPNAALNQAQVELRIITTNAAGNDEWVGIDDISIIGTTTGVTPPTLSANPLALSGNQGPAYIAGSGPSSVSLAVSGSNLDPASGIITVTTSNSAIFTVSSDNTNFGASSTIPYSNSALSSVPVYVQLVAGQGIGNYTGTIGIAGGGATLNVPVSGTVLSNGGSTRIHDIQGTAHLSPLRDQTVSNVQGIVTGLRSNGFYMQDPNPDNDDRTSEGIFVFQNATPTVPVGASVTVGGTVAEFRSGGSAGGNNLTTTQIGTPTVTVLSTGNTLPAATILGNGGRTIPTQIIEDQAGDVESGTLTFDPASDGIDFYESLEGMLVAINNPVTSSPTLDNSSIWVLADNGDNATGRTPRGGVAISANDFNPERILLYTGGGGNFPATSLAGINVNAGISSLKGIMDYFGGDYEVLPTTTLTITPSTLTREVSSLAPTDNQLTVATFNVENLDPNDGATKFGNLAARIVNNLRSPDIINLEEIQDNNGATNNGTVDASATFQALINAITAAGGPAYSYKQIDPVNGQDGGEPGGNIRVGFLFNAARVTFVDRPGGTSTAAVSVSTVNGQPQLTFSPGRIDPTNSAFSSSRKPLVGEFVFNGKKIFVIANHFNSKGGDQDLFGKTQPPVLSSEAQRVRQATIVRDFVSSIQAVDPNANIIVAGDLNDFQFSAPLTILKGTGPTSLTTLVETLPLTEQYTYNFGGNAQVIDHIMVSSGLRSRLDAYDVVHINSEFFDQDSDHDPSVARFTIPAPDLTPIIRLPQANFPASGDNATRNFTVELTEVAGQATSNGNIVITITAPLGYTLNFDNTRTTINVSGGTTNPVTVDNTKWTSTSGSTQLSLTINADQAISGLGTATLGFSITRAGASSGSTSNLTVNVSNDASKLYDGNSANNIYVRNIAAL